jgi:hypothetical protein
LYSHFPRGYLNSSFGADHDKSNFTFHTNGSSPLVATIKTPTTKTKRNNIPTLTFDGLLDGGSFNCGSYVFYFKFADSDGNLTNTI